jgi:hypothetical protein
VNPEDLAREAIQAYLTPRRRRLSFVAVGEGQSGFRAAAADDVLRTEFGAPRS